MSRLDALIQTLCPDGVEYKRMWELTTWDKKFNGISRYKQPSVIKYHYFLANELKNLATEEGNVKLLFTSTSEQGVTTEDKVGKYLCEGEIVAIPWGGNPQVQYYKGKFVTSDNRIATSNDTCRLSNKFLYYWMISKLPIIASFYRGSGIKHPSMAKVLDLKIPVPPLPVQEEIVRILDTFTNVVEALETELDARVRQYEYYRDGLLNFNESDITAASSPKIRELIETLCPDGVKYEVLDDLATISRGVRVVKNQLTEKGEFPVYQNSLVPMGFFEESNCTANTTFIISAGAAGEIGYSSVDFWAADDCFFFVDHERLHSKFLYYSILRQQKYLFSQVRRASVPRLARSIVEQLLIPVPPLPVQEEIVAVLDRFDTLVNDLKSGLPAEIAARRKQYEYYRDKLLTFPQKPPL